MLQAWTCGLQKKQLWCEGGLEQVAVMFKRLSLTQLEQKGGYAGSYSGKYATCPCCCAPDYGRVQLRCVGENECCTAGKATFTQHLQCNGQLR